LESERVLIWNSGRYERDEPNSLSPRQLYKVMYMALKVLLVQFIIVMKIATEQTSTEVGFLKK